MCSNEAPGQGSAEYKDAQRRAAAADQAQRQSQADAYAAHQKKDTYDQYKTSYTDQFENAWSQALNQAVSGASSFVNNKLSEVGMAEDPYDIMGLFSGKLEEWRGSQQRPAANVPGMDALEFVGSGQKVFAPKKASYEDYQVSPIYTPERYTVGNPQAVPNFAETLTPDYSSWFDSAFNARTGEQQSARAQQLNEAFGGLNANSLFPDTLDDPIISSILDPQYAEARAPLDRARSRGQIGAPVYNALLSGIDNERNKLTQDFQKFGGDLLSGYRTNLSNEMNAERQRASQSNLSDPYDPNAAAEGVRGKAQGWQDTLDDELLGKAGKGSLFSPIQALPYLTGAGNAGGAAGDKKGGPLLGQFEKQDRQMRSQGAF